MSIFAFLILAGAAGYAPKISAQGHALEPFQARPESIGDYNAGCLLGAAALPLTSPGLQVMRPSRRRYFAHPNLIRFVVDLGQHMSQNRLGTLRVGDLSQARGGPMNSGHASHQTGLDADLWFKPLRQSELQELTWHDLEALEAPTMVAKDNSLDSKNWNSQRGELLKHVANNDTIERVFVHPAIKRKLCQNYPNQPWLKKMRAWWGHDRHFHVRMKCPNESKDCKTQPFVGKNLGCGKELDWWFSPEAESELAKIIETRKTVKVKLPERCRELGLFN